MPRPRGRTVRPKKTRGGIPVYSLHPGVTFERGAYRRKPWKVSITTCGKFKFIGRFATELEGAQAYIEALNKYPL